MNLKANKKMVKDKLVGTTGKVIILKDISNVSTRMKSSNTRNDLQGSIRQLTEKYGEYILASHSLLQLA